MIGAWGQGGTTLTVGQSSRGVPTGLPAGQTGSDLKAQEKRYLRLDDLLLSFVLKSAYGEKSMAVCLRDAPQGVKSAQSNSAAVGEILAREELSVLLRSGRRRGGNRAYRHPFSQYSREGAPL